MIVIDVPTSCLYRILRSDALHTGVLCGLTGILPDLDHLPFYLGLLAEGRPLHPAFLLLSCAGITYAGGLLAYRVLGWDDH